MDNHYQTQPLPDLHYMAPHRGTLILVFGILGLVFCVLFGVAAWVMGNNDLRQMDSGQMDPTGRDLTQAGRICGMIASILLIVGLAIGMIVTLIAFAGMALAVSAL